MHMAALKVLTILVIGLFFTIAALADMVILKSGQKIEGKIIEKTDEYVKIDFQGVALVYYQEEVASITESGKQPPVLTTGLGFKPIYTPVDFAGLAEHYPVELGNKVASRDQASGNLLDDVPFDQIPQMQQILDDNLGRSGPPTGVDLSSATNNLPSQYKEMIESIKNNPQDISGALSSLPVEYREMIEEAIKNIPQASAINMGEKNK